MKKIALFFFIFLSLQCANERSANTIQSEDDKVITTTFPDQFIHDWVSLINTDRVKLSEFYLAKALLLNDKIETQSNLLDHFSILGESDILSFRSNTKVKATDDITYEILSLETEDEKLYSSFIVRNKKDGKEQIELQITVEHELSTADRERIKKAREKWIQLCNQHNANKLVNEMYTRDAIYYNHKPLVIGRKAITEEYAYMNNPKYNLNLRPLFSTYPNENLAFEIGQCSGSYEGKYVIIWHKGEDGEWKVAMDTNV